ncbi:MAG TPA: ExbD/TolR family protein [Candidatus Krumholzibacteria bacterium]|jgi:biopolymer transport protein TolR|nr:ExbD/TolR family protein [Candidatus Krumholzibacteria bacterium]
MMHGVESGVSGTGWGRRRAMRSMSEINITAFVDVLLVLLIIFMMTSQYLKAGFDVNLPKADTPGLEQRQDPLVVTLSVDKRLAVGDQVVPGLAEMREALQAQLHGATRPVYLKADRKVPYGTIVTVMAEIRHAGVRDIGLMTESGREDWFEQ